MTEGQTQKTPGVEEDKVHQQVGGGNNNILVSEAAGRGAPGDKARAYYDSDCYKDGRV